MKHFYQYILLIVISLAGKTFSQNAKIDSLLNILNKAKEDSDKVKTLNFLAGKFLKIGEYSKTINYAEQGEKLGEKLSHSSVKAIANAAKKGTAQANNIIGSVHYEQGNYDRAIQCFLKTLKIS